MPGTAEHPLIIQGRHALDLPGWDRCSIWGMDPVPATYGLFAQLWRDTDNGADAPRHWIMEVGDVLTLARRIAAAAGCTEDEAAMALLPGVRALEAQQGLA
jgi:hypothetical protein